MSFGTDGVRGVANRDLTPEDATRLGLAAARAFGGRIVVGRDTRISGGMLSGALVAGLSAGGAGVVDLGVIPTPGVAALAPRLGATAAAVVSASHNPYPDNGIKFFSGEGRKLPLGREREIEELTGTDFPRPTGDGVGAVETLDEGAGLYVDGALKLLSPDARGVKVLLDCANGAAYRAAPEAFGRIGAELSVVGAEPTGTNINEGCGSTHVGELDASGHDVAFAFDGDADRVLAVDERGDVVDGDKIIAILARDLQERGALGGGVVVTVMSNLGFFKAMDAMGVPYLVTPVGDRHVAGEMLRIGASVGGEQSGHVILSEHATTGDGLVTALALLDVMVRSGKPLSELASVMDVYPQKLINVAVGGAASAKAVAALDVVEGAVAGAEKTLGDGGRILLRPSGTEPVVRVMVEHEDEAVCREVCAEVARVVEAAGREEV
ncbi:phosphoglucosamine mutase [Rubrobacter tropicus]|uniref:Phosphoglucosamine mutase n=1 Tax=Rubrobacter tropicus TaxID=2653851 RepID=A0A6G8QFL3_9ACTN|nr:phosphoglucosamine mutase [Rubrobacter tropicus]